MGIASWRAMVVVAKISSALAASIFLAGYIAVVLMRIRYPYALEWIEGQTLEHIIRSTQGFKIFQKPSLDFIPLLYSPLYYYVCAELSNLLGVSLFAARLVSFTASLGCFGVIYLIVKRETDNTLSAFLSSCLFAATFKVSGTWFDLARVDSLHVFLLLTAVWLVRWRDSPIVVFLSGLLMALAYLCKQPALIMSVPILCYFAFRGWSRFLLFAGGTFGGIALAHVGLDWYYDGWFSFYIWDMGKRVATFDTRLFIKFWTYDLAEILPVACIGAAYFGLFGVNEGDSRRDAVRFFYLVAAGMIAGACASRSFGSNSNALIPAYAALAILLGLATGRALESVKELPDLVRARIVCLICFSWLVQFVSLTYDPFRFVPSAADRAAGDRFVRELAEVKGDVFVANHSYLALMAGKRMHASGLGIRLVAESGGRELSEDMVNQTKEAMKRRKFALIVLDGALGVGEGELNTFYERKGKVFDDDAVFRPVSEFGTRPQWIYVPRVGQPTPGAQ